MSYSLVDQEHNDPHRIHCTMLLAKERMLNIENRKFVKIPLIMKYSYDDFEYFWGVFWPVLCIILLSIVKIRLFNIQFMGRQYRIWFLQCPHQVSECSGDRDNDEWHMSGELRRVCSDGWWSEYCDMRLTGHGTTLEHHADHWQVANKKRINGLCNPPLSCSL